MTAPGRHDGRRHALNARNPASVRLVLSREHSGMICSRLRQNREAARTGTNGSDAEQSGGYATRSAARSGRRGHLTSRYHRDLWGESNRDRAKPRPSAEAATSTASALAMGAECGSPASARRRQRGNQRVASCLLTRAASGDYRPDGHRPSRGSSRRSTSC